MKRVLTILAIMLLPLSVWAMTPVTDSELSNVTGQAGVNINADITMDLSIGTMAWGDKDGLASVYNPWAMNGTSTTGENQTEGGYVGINDFNITDLTIKARTSDSYNGYSTLQLKPITIDVATTATGYPISVTTNASNGPADAFHGGAVTEYIPAGVTFVRFGLGSLVITLDALNFDVALGARTTAATNALTSDGLDQTLGEVSMGDMEVYINPWSYVDIYQSMGVSTYSGTASANCGVSFAVNVTIDHFKMGYMSWGDTDGLTVGNGGWMSSGTANEAAGYIGLSNFAIDGPIAINGTVTIDITTTSDGIYARVPSFVALLTGSTFNGNLQSQLGYLKVLLSSVAQNTTAVGIYSGVVSATSTDALSFYAAYTTVQMNAAIAYGTSSADAAFDKYVKNHGEDSDVQALFTAANTFGADVYSAAYNLSSSYAAYAYTDAATSVVHIAFPTNMIIDVRGAITGQVDLASNNLLSTGVSTLGDIYIQGLTCNIHSGSWVDIWAH